jgi:hypothetical protein
MEKAPSLTPKSRSATRSIRARRTSALRQAIILRCSTTGRLHTSRFQRLVLRVTGTSIAKPDRRTYHALLEESDASNDYDHRAASTARTCMVVLPERSRISSELAEGRFRCGARSKCGERGSSNQLHNPRLCHFTRHGSSRSRQDVSGAHHAGSRTPCVNACRLWPTHLANGAYR